MDEWCHGFGSELANLSDSDLSANIASMVKSMLEPHQCLSSQHDDFALGEVLSLRYGGLFKRKQARAAAVQKLDKVGDTFNFN